MIVKTCKYAQSVSNSQAKHSEARKTYCKQTNSPGPNPLRRHQCGLERVAEERAKAPDSEGEPDAMASLSVAGGEGSERGDEKRKPCCRKKDDAVRHWGGIEARVHLQAPAIKP